MNRKMEINCIKFEQKIFDFLNRNLDKKEFKLFQKHLANCQICKERYKLMKKIHKDFQKIVENKNIFAQIVDN